MRRAFSRAFDKAGINIAAKIPMMATTTKSSISVKPNFLKEIVFDDIPKSSFFNQVTQG